jgi:hypothetical protein
MADSWAIIAVKVKDRSATDLKNKLHKGTIGGLTGTQSRFLGKQFVSFVGRTLMGLLGGVRRGNIYGVILDNAGTRSTGNIACTRANAAGDTITFTYGAQTVVLTEATTPANENQFARGASDTTCAANLALVINNHSILGTLYTALGAIGDCGLTAKLPTVLMQDIAMTTSDGTAFAFTQLTGGNEGAAQFFLQSFSDYGAR